MEPESSEIPIVARLPEAARALKLSERKVWDMGKSGEIRRENAGRAVLYFPREYVERKRDDHGQRH